MAIKQTIRLSELYQGRLTNEQPVYPGVYEISDPRLFGTGEYLVTNGFAKALKPVMAPDPIPQDNNEDESVDSDEQTPIDHEDATEPLISHGSNEQALALPNVTNPNAAKRKGSK